MNRNVGLALGIGCILLLIVGVLLIVAVVAMPFSFWRSTPAGTGVSTSRPAPMRTIRPEPTFTVASPVEAAVAATPSTPGAATVQGEIQPLVSTADLLGGRFNQLNPGVVNIQVFISQANEVQGQGAGSGFVLDTAGHIITNHHVIDAATLVIVVFFDGFEEKAEVVGSDDDSDLAVLKVDSLPEGVHPLPLADSTRVQVGDWAIAIGNPFGLGSSMTLGIVSAVGRSIPSGAAQFSIPEAIQTDAAINPGNSGGPLFNLAGEVIGVNAQIRTGGVQANSGVGFAIPTNVLRQVVPTLISAGAYSWPWLGIEGADVNLLIAEANDLSTQQGAYIAGVVDGGPAAEAGLRGSSGVATVEGIQVPTGGDVVTALNGKPISSFTDLLAEVAFMLPGDTVDLTILRDGQTQTVSVTLAPRPDLNSAQ